MDGPAPDRASSGASASSPLAEPAAATGPESATDDSAAGRLPFEDVVSPEDQNLIHLQVNFDVFRVRARKGVFSQSEALWNHLDEQAVAARTAVLLQKNGLRVARGDVDAWPPIKAILENADSVETARSGMIVNDGLPFLLELGLPWQDRTLFMFRPDGRLAGASFTVCSLLLRIEYQVPVADLESIVVDVMPEIQQPRVAPRPELTPTGWVQAPTPPPGRVIRELGFRMQLGAEEFFVIGPSSSAHSSRHLAGSLLLCEDREGKPFESVYFVTPKVIRSRHLLSP